MNAMTTDRAQRLGGVLRAGLCLWAALAAMSEMGGAGAAEVERFEIVKVKAVRRAVAETIAALDRGDITEAKAAIDAYHSLFNGVEIYIGLRSNDAEQALEHIEAGIVRALNEPNPDATAATANAKALLAKYDETIDVIEKAPPPNSLYDDVARVRIARANLRSVVSALKAGHVESARNAFAEFSRAWETVADLVKAHAADDHAAIETGMSRIRELLDKADIDGATAVVADALDKLQATHNALLRAARSK